MYPKDYETGDEYDCCPHGPFQGCDCYDPIVGSGEGYSEDFLNRSRSFHPFPFEETLSRQTTFEEPTWKTGDGRVLKLSEMSDSHLASAFAQCVRRDGLQKPKTKSLLGEILRRAL